LALRSPQHAHDLIGLSVSFWLGRAQPVDRDFDKLGGLFNREQYRKAFLLGAICKGAVHHGSIDRAVDQRGETGVRAAGDSSMTSLLGRDHCC
jgi:hypothetical protein